jgi:hypothetical protein
MEHFARVADDRVPLKCGARVYLVGLNVEMAKDALVAFEFLIGQFLKYQFPATVFRVIAPDFR